MSVVAYAACSAWCCVCSACSACALPKSHLISEDSPFRTNQFFVYFIFLWRNDDLPCSCNPTI